MTDLFFRSIKSGRAFKIGSSFSLSSMISLASVIEGRDAQDASDDLTDDPSGRTIGVFSNSSIDSAVFDRCEPLIYLHGSISST